MNTSAAAKEKFDLFVAPEISILNKMAYRLAGNKVDAEDLLQECLIKAFRALDSFDGEFPSAWLFTILRNTHLNRVRVRKHVLIDDWKFLEDSTLNHQDSVNLTASSSEDQYLNTGLSEALITGIRSLSQDFREVIYLVDIEGLSYIEAGKLLGIRTATVTSRLNRARTKLRDYLITNKSLKRKGENNERI